MTTQNGERQNLINLIIGISLLVFVLMLAFFIFSIVLQLAPIIGILIAVAGGIWYLQADDDSQKVRALQTLLAGGAIAVIFGIIF